MKPKDALAEYDNHLSQPSSVEIARDTLQCQLAWIEYVPEGEFTAVEAARLLRAYRALYGVLRPLTAKYID